ncbi:hypothetical protein D3C87_1664610 [compost metagenome]
MRRLDLLLTEHHVAPLFVLHTFNDVLFGHLLAGDLVDALIADRLHAPAVEPVEIHPLGRRRRDQRDRDMHQPETDCAFPDCSWHRRLLPSDDQVTRGLEQKFQPLWPAFRGRISGTVKGCYICLGGFD